LLSNLNLIFANINGNQQELTKNLVSLIPTEEERIKAWREYPELKFEKLEQYIEDFQDGLKLKILSQEFHEILTQEIEKSEYKTAKKDYEIYRDIIKFFEGLEREHQGEEIIIPGVNKSIQDFIEILIEQNKENTKINKKIELTTSCLKNLDDIAKDIDSLEKIHFVEFSKQKEIEAKKIDTPQKVVDIAVRNLQEEIKDYRKKIDEYEKACREFDIKPEYVENYYTTLIATEVDLNTYIDFTEKQIQEEIRENEKNIVDLTRAISNTSGELSYKRREIEKLKQQKVHPFHNDLHEINILSHKTRILAQKFLVKYRDYLKSLKNQNPEKISENENEKIKYYQELGKYFAKKTEKLI